MMQHMLTTEDNPFDPFTQFDEWFAFDTFYGYDSSGYLARILVSSEELSEADQMVAVEQAIDEIIIQDLYGYYKKVSREVAST